MAQYRKKPVVIEAIQWTGNNLKEVIDFSGLHPSASKWSWEEYENVVAKDGLKIFSREGKLDASINDWIVKGNTKEAGDHFWVVKPDYFEQNYEPIN